MVTDARTEKLYLADPYASSFEATVLSCETDAKGRLCAILDRTHFYPESGGQPSDRGTLGGAAVVDVQEGEAGAVRHFIDRPLQVGRVAGVIDRERRFDHMQQHTGQHVLSRSFIEVGKLVTVSFHLGDEICTIDLDGPAPNDEIVSKVEMLANSIIWENRPVLVRTGTHAQMEGEALRKAVPLGVSEVRLVEVEGFDTIGCCGTHVRRTGEIGVIKVLKYEKTKGVYRAHFLAGKRAFSDFAKKHDIVKNLANRFTTAADALEDKIEKLHSESQRLRKDGQKLLKKLAVYEAERLHAGASRHGDRIYVVEVVPDADEEFLRIVGSHLKSKAGTVSLLATDAGEVVCNAADDVAVDLPSIAVARAKALGGGGGGRGGFATVRLPEKVSPSDFLRAVYEDLRNV
jgi:alanyl-tRNA synthetase